MCGTFDVTNGVTVYVDGAEVIQQPPNENVPCDGTVNVRIVSRVDGQFLKAVVDEVAIWNRVLSVDEISQNMSGGSLTAVKSSDKVATMWGSIKAQD